MTRPIGTTRDVQLLMRVLAVDEHEKRVRHQGFFDARRTFPRNEALFTAIRRGWRADW